MSIYISEEAITFHTNVDSNCKDKQKAVSFKYITETSWDEPTYSRVGSKMNESSTPLATASW